MGNSLKIEYLMQFKQNLADQIFDLGKNLKLPFFEGLQLSFNQLVIGKEVTNCYQKIRLIAKAVFGAAVAISTLPIYLMGGTLQFISQLIHKSSFQIQKKEIQENADKSCLIASWNVCSFDGGLSVPFGGLAANSKRITQIAEKIMTVNPDIIALQEVGIKSCDLLKKKLNHYAFYHSVGNSCFFFSSGLTLLSKIPLHNVKYHPFKEGVFMKRGFLTFETDKFFGVTTHLQPGKCQETRQTQLNEIKEKVKSFSTKPVIIFGDLNWQRPVHTDGFTDLSIEIDKCTATNRLKEFTIFGKPNDEPDYEAIDTILVTTLDAKRMKNFRITEVFNSKSLESLSDHHLISAEFL